MDLGLYGRKVLVAGGGRGIGKAIAMVLVEEGADVAIASRTQTELEKTAGEIECSLKKRSHLWYLTLLIENR